MLSELHDKAPVHSWEASKAAIETAFGQPVEQLFESIDHSAIASGSIAQVRTLQHDPVSLVTSLFVFSKVHLFGSCSSPLNILLSLVRVRKIAYFPCVLSQVCCWSSCLSPLTPLPFPQAALHRSRPFR